MRISTPAAVLGLALSLAAALPTVAPAADLADLAWLAGCWHGEAGEECWLAPQDGLMLGMNRASSGGFEYLRIVAGEDGRIVYLASPGGRCPATPFPAVEVAEGRAVFANPEHDFPQRITYWLDAEGALHARVEAGDPGAERGFELVWRRR